MNLNDKCEEKPARAIWKQLMILVERVHCLARNLEHERGVDFSLQMAQGKILFYLCNYTENGIRLKDLAKLMTLTSGSLSPVVESLVKLNLVERQTDPADRRAILLKPTEKAWKIQRIRSTYMSELEQRLLSSFSTEELTVLKTSLERMYGILDQEIKIPSEVIEKA